MTHARCNKYNIDALFIGWQYDDIAKNVLSQYKYRYAYKLSKIISKLLLKRLEVTNFLNLISSNSVLVPIPSHKAHIKKRGFNQSALIAKELSVKLNIPIVEDSLVRDRDKRYQAKLEVKERKSLKKVFNITRKIDNKEIVLIDDVVTTGSTINKAAMSFKNKSIKAIALFRGRPHYHQ
jgi:competence protein ComFC